MAEASTALRPADILETGTARARERGLPYAGALTPREAWALVETDAAVLIDVRTSEELQWVGFVPGALHVEWKAWKAAAPRPEFSEDLSRTVAKDRPVLFLCRSGVRSQGAARAAAAAGYTAFDVLEGFEGGLDADQHRGKVDGWRKAGLPWRQN